MLLSNYRQERRKKNTRIVETSKSNWKDDKWASCKYPFDREKKKAKKFFFCCYFKPQKCLGWRSLAHIVSKPKKKKTNNNNKHQVHGNVGILWPETESRFVTLTQQKYRTHKQKKMRLMKAYIKINEIKGQWTMYVHIKINETTMQTTIYDAVFLYRVFFFSLALSLCIFYVHWRSMLVVSFRLFFCVFFFYIIFISPLWIYLVYLFLGTLWMSACNISYENLFLINIRLQ